MKVGAPNCPVAAAEHGRQVLVHFGSWFQVYMSDHDFTLFNIVPSVTLLTDIPEEISGSWYSGKVHVLYKEGAFEPSSPATELLHILREKAATCPVLYIYSDGGPDHRVTYMSVKLAQISLFCTAPYHSYRNPAVDLKPGLTSSGAGKTNG